MLRNENLKTMPSLKIKKIKRNREIFGQEGSSELNLKKKKDENKKL